MSNLSDTPAPLTPNQRRVLGVLIEKAKTTPDAYPLSVNALVNGCNQKSNRDPIMDLDDADISDVLDELRSMGVVEPVYGGRVERFKHILQSAWSVSKQELAILGELLLRGPQSIGDLRGRASRMDPFPSLDDLREVLKPLQERGFVVFLTAEDRRGAILTHGFHTPDELAEHKATAAGMVDVPVRANVGRADSEIAQLRAEVAELREEVARLRDAVAQLGE